MAHHPNKHIRAAVEYAEQRGWTLRKAGARAHVWGRLYCPNKVVRVAREQFTLPQEVQKITQRTFVEPWTVVLTEHEA